jgi:hypothetical protein
MNELIKRPGLKTEFEPWMLQEMDKCDQDPAYFLHKYIYVQHPKKGRMLMEQRDYQDRMINAFKDQRWCIVKSGRQTGKTATIAAFLLWFAIFHDDKYVMVASNKNAGAMDIMNRIRYAYEELPMWMKPGCEYWNKHEVVFDNGSTLISSATTDQTGRGRSISLLMLDELAFVRPKIQNEMWTSLAPTLSTGGSCIVSSTPNGDQELFSKLWRQAEVGIEPDPVSGEDEEGDEIDADLEPFFPVSVRWDEVPGRDEKYRRSMIAKITEPMWLQEYECQFVSSDPLLIDTRILQNLRESVPITIDKGFSFWKEIDPRKTYMIGCDVGQGLGQDFSTIEVFELEGMEQVAEFRSNKIKENQLYNAIKFIAEKIHGTKDQKTGKPPTIYWSFENNAVGAAIAALHMNDETFPEDVELHSDDGKKLGVSTNGKSKILACRTMKNLMEKAKGGMKIHSKTLIAEFKNYIQHASAYAAKEGSTDDLISAVLVIMRIITFLSTYEPDVFQKIYDTDEEFYDENTNGFDEPYPFVF